MISMLFDKIGNYFEKNAIKHTKYPVFVSIFSLNVGNLEKEK